MKKKTYTIDLYLFGAISILFLWSHALCCIASSLQPKISKPPMTSETERIIEDSGNSEESDCVRGEPEPVFKNSTFKRMSQFTAIEEYRLNENIYLTVNHFGCAHFSERYTFKVKANIISKNDWRSWMNFAADQLSALPVQEITAMQINTIVSALRDRVKNSAPYDYTSQISISEEEFLFFEVKSPNKDFFEIIILYQFIL